MKEFIYVDAKIDADTFKKFAYFDAFRLKKHYRTPLLFTALMTIFAVACFLLADKPQARMLGGVLLAIGLILPLVYFGMFAASLRTQTKTMKRNGPQNAYTLTLTEEEDGVSISKGEEHVKLKWRQVYGAYRVKGCIYLYAHPTKAFLLPSGQASVSDDRLFEFLRRMLGEKRSQDCRTKRQREEEKGH